MSTVGSRIRQRRQELGMSADELAAKLGKNRATVYRYESDDIENFPISVIDSLANALQVSPAYLMGWSEVQFFAGREAPGQMSKTFREKLSHIIENRDKSDLAAAGLDLYEVVLIINGAVPLSLDMACQLAEQLGESLDSMLGLDTAKSAPGDGSGLDMEIINRLISLPDDKKAEAVSYIRYLADSARK